MAEAQHIVILGAGSIGGFVGGCWIAAGLPVTMVGRRSFADEIEEAGLTVSDERGWSQRIAPEDVDYRTDPSALSDATLIVLTVKSGATAEAGQAIAAHARPGTPILSLQNGVGNLAVLRGALGERFPLLQGMVPFNVAYLGRGHFHKGVAGQLYAENVPAMRKLAEAVGQSPAGLTLSDDMAAIAWGKLLINLNNAVNALSGRPLREQLISRDYRRVMAATLREGLSVLDGAGIAPAKIGAVGPRLLPKVMESPDWLFRNWFMRKWKIDAKARSSMADDLAQGRKTEIDFLNGEIIALAGRSGRDAPINRRIVELVHSAETGGRRDWGPRELAAEVLARR